MSRGCRSSSFGLSAIRKITFATEYQEESVSLLVRSESFLSVNKLFNFKCSCDDTLIAFKYGCNVYKFINKII